MIPILKCLLYLSNGKHFLGSKHNGATDDNSQLVYAAKISQMKIYKSILILNCNLFVISMFKY